MILAALLLALSAAMPIDEPVSEIVVLGRLRTIGVNVGQDSAGQWHCGLDRSTGRASLDDRLCRAVTKCVRKGADSTDKVDACIRTSRANLVREVERTMNKGSK